jgi:hypothetical protein
MSSKGENDMRKLLRWLAIVAIVTGLSSCAVPFITWIEVTSFVNGWGNYSAPGARHLSYGRDSNGLVHIRGVISDATPVASSNICDLPLDYAPSISGLYSVPVDFAVGNGTAILSIGPNGSLNIQSLVPASLPISNIFIGEIIYDPS